MLLKLKINRENLGGMGVLIDANFTKKTLTYQSRDISMIEKPLDVSRDEVEEFLENTVYFWKDKYIGKDILDGSYTEILIVTDKKVLTYRFKDEYPENFKDVMNELERMLMIDGHI